MRVLITRAEDNAIRSAARLRALGHEAVICPLTEIVALKAALPASPFLAALATSAHAPRLLCEETFGRVVNVPLYAVGEETARSARARGFKTVVAAKGDARALAHLVARSMPAPADILYLAGRDRKRDMEAILTLAGYTIEVLTVYEAQEVALLSGEHIGRMRPEHLDAVLHYSRRSAEIYCRLIKTAGFRDNAILLRHFCLSDDVAQPLRELGVHDIRVAARPDEDHLLAGLAR
jgi:uroporphyrinogen-III synthase